LRAFDPLGFNTYSMPYDIPRRRSSLPLLLIVVWAALLIALIALRPSPSSFRFSLLLVPAMVCGGAYMLLSDLESRRTRRETLAWLRRLNELVDIHDFRDDGHLPEYLDDSERRRVIEELERLPRGSRSLRRAIAIVSPDLVREDG
jgi:hypothetical protein